jgi:DtxR family Mn-dependent transcriptional regulator
MENCSPQKLTGSQENYLEYIFRNAPKEGIRVRDLAAKLRVALPSVTRAVSVLKNRGLVRHQSYGKIQLTDEGEAVGREIVRRDACLTRILVEIFAMTESEADPHVHRLEHVIDESVLLRLEAFADFALESPAWIKRLRHRIDQNVAAKPGMSITYNVGSSILHRGARREKSSQ